MNTQSPIYVRRIKRLTQMVKGLRGLSKIPRALPRPNSDAYKLSNSLSAKDAQKRQEEYVKKTQFRVDKTTIAFFAVPYSLTSNSGE